MTALTGRKNAEKYDGSYEVAAKVVDTFVSPHHKTNAFRALFKSIVLSVAVRNGDAHLKNFGLLYTTPLTDDVRLSPLYDIVNTTSYLSKDILALKMAKTKSWPTRKTLIEFGRMHCKLDQPGQIIDQVLDAVNAYVPQIDPGAIWMRMRKQIEAGSYSIANC
jgi:serine/threonine-protein kinase HipA